MGVKQMFLIENDAFYSILWVHVYTDMPSNI